MTHVKRLAPPVIGLIGSIGAGKSTVAKILTQLGCLVCDSDALGREALQDPSIIATLAQWWGDGVRCQDGTIDRRKVAAIVFPKAGAESQDVEAARQQRQRLEALVHPWIEAKRQSLFANCPPDSKALVIDAPLLLEAGIHKDCSSILFIDAPIALRLQRLADSRGWSPEELRGRESAQMPLDRKRSFADHVLINDADLESLRAQVARTLSLILNVQ